MTTGPLDEEAIFQVARKISDGAARAAYLDLACGNNANLRDRVSALLHVHEREEEFLKSHPGVAMTAEHTPITEAPGTQIGPYKLLQQIGEGGFGVVYMAEQQEPVHRRVALKIIKPGMDSRQVIARFEAERQALALMDHPNIAKVLDAGATEVRQPFQADGSVNRPNRQAGKPDVQYGRPYFVMELVHGIPITKYCDDNRLSPRERLALFIPVCHAIQHAHQKGIIHRDIKPSNILVCLYDGVPVPKVIDFGVAKAIQQRLTEKTMFTQFGQVIGTLEYMSPEQAEMNQLDIDTRSDVYALGTVLYELLTGTTPFEPKRLRTAAFDEMLRIIREDEPPRPSLRLSTSEKLASISAQRQTDPAKLSRLVKGELDWIVMKALEKQRSRRYETASGLAKDIQRYLDGEPVTAAAPSAGYRIRKYARRHRAALAVAATIAGLLVAGTITSSVLALKATRATARETEQRIRAEAREQDVIKEQRRTQEQKAAADAARREAERHAYARAMQLAQSDWESGSLARSETTLTDTASYPDRGFEWYHLQGRLHQERRTIHPQLGPLVGVRLAADQGEIIVDAEGYKYRLDAATGNLRAVYGDVPMSADGRWLAVQHSAEPSDRTTVIDTTTGTRRDVLFPAAQRILALSPVAGRLITVDAPDWSSVRLWDVETATQAGVFTHQDIYFAEVQFSPDGQCFAGNLYLKGKSVIELRRASDGEPIRAPSTVEGRFLGFTPDSQHLARWNPTTRQIHLHKTTDLSDHKQIPCEFMPATIAFSPNGTCIAIAAPNHVNINESVINKVVINELETGRMVSSYRVDQVTGVSFSRDGCELITVSWNGSVKVFPIAPPDYIHIGSPVSNAQFNRNDGSRLLLMTEDDAQLIDVAAREVVRKYPRVGNAAIFPDGRRIATAPPQSGLKANSSTEITIFDEQGGQVDRIEYNGRVVDLVVAPDGRHLFVSGPDSCSLLNIKTGKTIFQHPEYQIRAFGFLPDGKQFAIAFEGESVVRFFDVVTNQQVDSMRCEPGEARIWVQFSTDGKLLVTPYTDPETSIEGVSIYDLTTKERVRTITGHAGLVKAAHFSPDGRRLFTQSRDGTMRLWDTEDGLEFLSLHEGVTFGELPGVIYPILFPGRAVSPDGRLIAISGPQGIYLKEAATPEQVAAWQKPPTQVKDTHWERVGGVQDWLVLAPIHLGEQQDLAVALDMRQLPNESDLRPSAGDVEQVGGQDIAWKRASTNDCVLDFQKVTSPNEDYCLAYAVTYIHSDQPRKGARLLLGSDDFAKVYLNGEVVHESRNKRAAIPADDQELVDLRAGKNVLVFKVIDGTGPWGAAAQIVGDDYQPIPGVTTGTNP